MPSMPPPGLGCPGPGAYNALGALHNLKMRRNFSKAGASASFNPNKNAQKVPSSGSGQEEDRMLPTAQEVSARHVPGPAYYNPSLPKLQKSFRMKSSAFV
eukprot:Skav210948  [mRNA]  locus=scaffold713:262048:265983:+ [translate_table: standard]